MDCCCESLVSLNWISTKGITLVRSLRWSVLFVMLWVSHIIMVRKLVVCRKESREGTGKVGEGSLSAALAVVCLGAVTVLVYRAVGKGGNSNCAGAGAARSGRAASCCAACVAGACSTRRHCRSLLGLSVFYSITISYRKLSLEAK
jgi:hypothetical protein